MSSSFSSIISCSFMHSGLIFKSFIQFEYIFVYCVRSGSRVIFFHIDMQFPQHHLLKRVSFTHVCSWCPFQMLVDHIYVALFLGSIFFIIQYVCFYVCTILFDDYSFVIQFGNRKHDPASFEFFLKIVLANQDLLKFHINFRIVCSISVKSVIEILTGIALNLQITLGSVGILTILILPICKSKISFQLFV